ncbi:NAD(P)H-binding protein [Methylobacterium sp. Leaf118]|uniref:NAD(P)H-binding protein n=1 Tax=Methylobacterium sp. Leaf118 TaxID=2876562 RepID=UPI001E3412A5|nr:NAD(P)H-binding protein [Methylobacterium sp. Leaf118]
MSNLNSGKILVTGAAGRLGTIAVQTLREAGLPVVAGTRDPAKLALPIETRRVDFDDPDTLTQAFAGIDRLLLISTDVIDQPGRRLTQHRAAVAAAAAAGISHIAYTSTMNPGRESPLPLAKDHHGTEAAILETGIPFTFLRNSLYQENLALDLPAIKAGDVYSAAGEGRTSYVAIGDAARAAAGVVAQAIPGIFDITGPESLTTAEVIARASEALGQSVTVRTVTEDALIAALVAAGLPQGVVELMAALERVKRLNLSAQVTDRVKLLSGRDPEPITALFARAPFAPSR